MPFGGIGLIDLRYGVVEGISARLDLDLPIAGLMPDGVAAPEANLKATGSVEPLEGWRWRSEAWRWARCPRALTGWRAAAVRADGAGAG